MHAWSIPAAVVALVALAAAGCGSSRSPSSSGTPGTSTSAPAPTSAPAASATKGASTFDLTFSGSASFHLSGTPSMCSIGSNGGFMFGLDGKTFAPIGEYFQITAFQGGQPLVKWLAPDKIGYLGVNAAGLTFSADHHDLTARTSADGSGGRVVHVTGTVHCA
jgi:hypothetical protein